MTVDRSFESRIRKKMAIDDKIDNVDIKLLNLQNKFDS